MTQDSAHVVGAPTYGEGADPAKRGGTIGSDETQRIPATTAPPDATTTQIRAPGALDLAGSQQADQTDVLRLDELFERPEPAGTAPAGTAPTAPATAQAVAPPARKGPSAIERLLDDGAAAWDGAVRRGENWLRAGDNALMAVTVIAAIVLILVVATFGN